MFGIKFTRWTAAALSLVLLILATCLTALAAPENEATSPAPDMTYTSPNMNGNLGDIDGDGMIEDNTAPATALTTNPTTKDNDSDGIPDKLDPDDDNDGIHDSVDKDADGNGKNDSTEGTGIGWIAVLICVVIVVAVILIIVTVVPKKKNQ